MARLKGLVFTDKQKKFCEEYLIDLNGTAAAVRAGYSDEGKKSAQTMASELLDQPHIKARIQELMDARSEKTKVTAEYVLENIVQTIERCKQAEPVMEWDHDSKSMQETGEWQFDSRGVLKGCELLGRHLKMFTDKLEIDDKSGLAERLAKARKAIGK